MTELGHYVTNQYGILKLIFSHLSSKDLWNASQVCRDWKDVAKRVQKEHNLNYFIQIYNTRPGCVKSLRWDKFNEKVEPSLVIHFSTTSAATPKRVPDVYRMVTETYNYSRPVYSVLNSWYISSKLTKDGVEVFNEKGKGQALLILPKMPGVNIDIFSFIGNRDVTANSRRYKAMFTNAKCVLIIHKASLTNVQKVRNFISTFDSPENCIMAGGLAHKLIKYEKENGECFIDNHFHMLGIAFSGDNVSAHSEVYDSSCDINTFMAKFAKKVGPKPAGCGRIAFMFVCVNKAGCYEQEESDVFSKYFPSVPVYGFWSLGEYCIRNPGSDEEEPDIQSKRFKASHQENGCKKGPLKFLYEECTSFLVITFKKII